MGHRLSSVTLIEVSKTNTVMILFITRHVASGLGVGAFSGNKHFLHDIENMNFKGLGPQLFCGSM